ncbi:putative serine/threonine-protein kinase isoform X1 [Andrographis paniculata]|uniref:putative serine/threonine-protein kinase isoform X1 n=1 Tax=Andrographis paniculata TaxID=175694 RepID=UPI0021E8231F|nr:putative serine/threonine-protein kinase isoform X1 [Andrographis paniculata]
MKFADSLFQCFNPVAVDDAAEADEGGGERGGDGGDSANSDFRVFSYNELKAATQGFKNKIGEGGFGSVYKGRLVGDNLIAVKVLSVELESLRGEREFISEIAALSGIKHENLVTLRGCCVDGAQRLLVYDYMENNSLWHAFLGSEQNRVKFTWTLRKHVCLGIAKGLCYLHEELNPHIVHRDIKASNILLDQDYTPKLADFGLAKLFRDSMSYVSTHVAGTWGYISPEYAHSGHLTRKSDIYSFGVVLLEIMSGQPIVDYHVQQGDLFLVEKAWELYNAGKLLDLVDPAMNGEFPNEEAIRFLKLGLLCVQETTRLRPTISEAMKMMTNEINTDNVEIKRPGLVANLMEVKIREKNSSNFTSSQATSSTVSFQGR